MCVVLHSKVTHMTTGVILHLFLICLDLPFPSWHYLVIFTFVIVPDHVPSYYLLTFLFGVKQSDIITSFLNSLFRCFLLLALFTKLLHLKKQQVSRLVDYCQSRFLECSWHTVCMNHVLCHDRLWFSSLMPRLLLQLGMHWMEEAYQGKIIFVFPAYFSYPVFNSLHSSIVIKFADLLVLLHPDTCFLIMSVLVICVFHTQHIKIWISNFNQIAAGNDGSRQDNYRYLSFNRVCM